MEPISAIIAGVGGLAQAGVGVGQMIQAKRYRDRYQRPDYEIPTTEEEALRNARTMASMTSLPGEALIEQRLRSSAMGEMRALAESGQTPSQMAVGAGQVYGREQQGLQTLGLQGAQFQAQQQAGLRSQLSQMSGYIDKQFDINKMQPYQAAMAAAAALSGAGQQNIGKGLGTIAGAGQLMAGGGQGVPQQVLQSGQLNSAPQITSNQAMQSNPTVNAGNQNAFHWDIGNAQYLPF